MSNTSPPWRAEIYAILPHPRAPRILMLLEESGWSLPHVSLGRGVWQASADKVNAAMRQQFGLATTTLRCVHYQEDEAARQSEAVFVLESHDPAWTPPEGATWVGAAALGGVPFTHPKHRALVTAHLAEVESGQLPKLRRPWARPGWFDQAAAWTRSELERLGYTLAAPVEQVKSWALSAILRAPTTAGDVYFKVATELPLFAHEPLLMRGLAELYPENVPAPLSIDESRRWMLLADFGPAVGWDAPVEVQEEMLLIYGALQRDAASRVEALQVMGCLDRSLARLAAQIDPLLTDSAALVSQLDAAEIERLRLLAPRLKAICAKLGSYAVPHTLVHGDLHLGNVARPADQYLFFDWTDACVAHPFFDTISIFQSEDPSAETRLRDSYLSVWTEYEPMERLLEVWTLAKPLCALHQAVSYQHIIATAEKTAKSESASGLSYWLRKLLQWLDESSVTGA